MQRTKLIKFKLFSRNVKVIIGPYNFALKNSPKAIHEHLHPTQYYGITIHPYRTIYIHINTKHIKSKTKLNAVLAHESVHAGIEMLSSRGIDPVGVDIGETLAHIVSHIMEEVKL